MISRRFLTSATLTLGGFGILIWLVTKYGPATYSAVRGIHAGGFALYFGSQLGLEFGLGLCWWLLFVRPSPNCLVFWWARMVRDGAGEFLPFSHIGGYVMAARAITLLGVSRTVAAASSGVDVLFETLAEVAFVAFGLVLFVGISPHSPLLAQVALGLVLAALGVCGLIYLQQGTGHRWVQWAGTYILGQAAMQALEFHLVQGAIDDIYRRQNRIILATFGHFIGTIGTGLIGWVGLHILGSSISLTSAIALEAMLHGILAFSFLVPGRLGVQEAAYIGLGLVFGIPADLALSMSLVRRGRNFLISVPILVSWQILEVRRLR